ncbi:MAG: M28 family peptidase [Planctomycetes bacterium]|nr:M28 family peptidase [Planctomycetota bacterium]
MPSRRFFSAILAALLLALIADSALAQKPFDDPVLERMRKDIFFLAGPECEGRGVETKGIEKAADYVADAFKQAGLKPAMRDGSYFQPFNITAGVKLGAPTSLTLLNSTTDVTKELKSGTEFSVMGFSPTSKANAGLVFVGYGITAPKLKYDDYEGIDAAGKIVVMLRRIPRYGEKGEKRFDTNVATSDESEYAPFVAKIENAVAHKAVGIIMVNDTGAGPRDPLPQFLNHAMGTEPAPFPVMFVKREILDPLLASGAIRTVADIETLIDKDLKPRSFEIKGWKANAEVTVERTEFKCKNIIGVLEGAGPLADETVVIGAHYDHVGYGNFASLGGPSAAGKIHYGADDNASGTTGLIELARRFGAMKNRQGRRLVFIAFSAEERGLFGSQFYCKNPLFPLDKTAAMVNMDMIGRTKPVPTDWLGIGEKKDRLIVYGVGTGDGFEKLVDLANGKTEFKVSKIAAGSGPSDHDSFYRKKVPVLFLYTGTHGEYHRPTDVPEKINVPGMKKVADFVQVLADDLTTRDKPKYFATKDPWSDPTETRSPRGPSGPKLGVLPDYMYEGEGMRLEGVSPGGAAEKGGIKDGDVIVEIGGKPVKNVTGYMTAMSGQKAGTAVEVVVLRKEKRVTLKVTPE